MFKSEDQPISTAIFSLSVMQSFYINCILDYFMVVKYSVQLEMKFKVAITAILVALNFFVFYKNSKKIIAEKPLILSSSIISVLISILFAVFSIVTMIINPAGASL